jgi:hypothetical protein
MVYGLRATGYGQMKNTQGARLVTRGSIASFLTVARGP